MAKTTKKLVLSLDPEAKSYAPAGHNLTEEQAVEVAGKLQADGKGSLVLEQEDRHRALRFHNCKFCKMSAEAATNEIRKASGQQAEQPPTAKATETEDD